MTKFLIYGRDDGTCFWCEAAKGDLDELGIPYDFKPVSRGTPNFADLQGLLNAFAPPIDNLTVPQIFEYLDSEEGMRYIGGYIELAERVSNERAK